MYRTGLVWNVRHCRIRRIRIYSHSEELFEHSSNKSLLKKELLILEKLGFAFVDISAFIKNWTFGILEVRWFGFDRSRQGIGINTGIKTRYYLPRFIPIDRFLSHRYLSNPSLLRFKDTRLTWELSIAWSCIPDAEHSNVASFSKSLMASKIFFKMELWTNLASNMMPDGKKHFLTIRGWDIWKFGRENEHESYTV